MTIENPGFTYTYNDSMPKELRGVYDANGEPRFLAIDVFRLFGTEELPPSSRTISLVQVMGPEKQLWTVGVHDIISIAMGSPQLDHIADLLYWFIIDVWPSLSRANSSGMGRYQGIQLKARRSSPSRQSPEPTLIPSDFDHDDVDHGLALLELALELYTTGTTGRSQLIVAFLKSRGKISEFVPLPLLEQLHRGILSGSFLEHLPEEQPAEVDNEGIRDSSGTLYDPTIHSTKKSDGTPVICKDGSFAARRGTKTKAATVTAPADNGQDKPDEVQPEKKPKLYVVRDANGEKVIGGTVSTAREFATGLINYLSNNLDAVAHKAIMTKNNGGLVRLLAEDRSDLFDEIDEVTIDAVTIDAV